MHVCHIRRLIVLLLSSITLVPVVSSNQYFTRSSLVTSEAVPQATQAQGIQHCFFEVGLRFEMLGKLIYLKFRWHIMEFIMMKFGQGVNEGCIQAEGTRKIGWRGGRSAHAKPRLWQGLVDSLKVCCAMTCLASRLPTSAINTDMTHVNLRPAITGNVVVEISQRKGESARRTSYAHLCVHTLLWFVWSRSWFDRTGRYVANTKLYERPILLAQILSALFHCPVILTFVCTIPRVRQHMQVRGWISIVKTRFAYYGVSGPY